MKYRADIDGLRAFSVISVIVFHAFPDWLSGGFIGVDVFFVISGFLITTIIFKNLEKGTFSFVYFFSRRVRRIFPALFLVMLASLVFGWFALLEDEYAQLGKHVAGGAAFIANYIFWNEAGYFDNAADTKPLLHLWSLGVEEQFYLVWPLALWLASKAGYSLIALTLIVAISSFFYNVLHVDRAPEAIFFLPAGRFWELLSGSILAWLMLYKGESLSNLKLLLDRWLARFVYTGSRDTDGGLISNLLSFLGLGMLAFGVIRIHEELAFPGQWAVVPVAGALLVIGAGPRAWFNRTLLMNPVSIWIGLISYPLYLWHWPILSFFRLMEEDTPGVGLRLLALCLSVLLAWLTYSFVELQIRRQENLGKVVVVLVAGMTAVGATGMVVYLKNGYPDRQANAVYEKAGYLFVPPSSDTGYHSCAEFLPKLDTSAYQKDHCTVLSAHQPNLALIGDSHALQYAPSLASAGLEDHVVVVQGNRCLPFASDDYQNSGTCRKKFESLISFLENDRGINKVLLSAFWSRALSGDAGAEGINWRLAAEPDENDIRTFRNNARRLLRAALGHDRQVVFMRDIPILDFDIRRCFELRPIRITDNNDLIADCSISRTKTEARERIFDEIIDALLQEFPEIIVYDPSPVFCSDNKCRAAGGGIPYYFDGDHLNRIGADMVIDDLVRNGLIR